MIFVVVDSRACEYVERNSAPLYVAVRVMSGLHIRPFVGATVRWGVEDFTAVVGE